MQPRHAMRILMLWHRARRFFGRHVRHRAMTISVDGTEHIVYKQQANFESRIRPAMQTRSDYADTDKKRRGYSDG